MANMGYCRFQNTLADLRDCMEAMDDPDISADESRARQRLIALCTEIAEDYGNIRCPDCEARS